MYIVRNQDSGYFGGQGSSDWRGLLGVGNVLFLNLGAGYVGVFNL